jgi:hypothetical protein
VTARARRFPWLIASLLAGGVGLVGLLAWRVTHGERAPDPMPVEAVERDPAPAPRPAFAPPPRAPAPVSPPQPAASPPDEPGEASPSPVREQAQAIFERRLPTLTSPAHVDAFLDELRTTARARHAVTATEVEPGLMAIRLLNAQLSPDEVIRREVAFSQEMARMSREYRDGTR